MEIIKTELPNSHEIGWSACFHFGNSNQHTDGIKKYIEWLKAKKNRFGFINGDIAEAIHSRDKRYEADQHKQLILDQYADAVDMFKPVKHKIIGANAGNHDYKINSYGDFVAKCFCKPLDIKYGTFSSKIHVHNARTRKLMYKVFATHGNGSVKSTNPDPVLREGYEKSKIKKKLAAERHGDCYLNIIAHFHKALIIEPYRELYLIDDGSRIKQQYMSEADPLSKWIPEDLRWYMSVPGFVKKYGNELRTSGYAERGGLTPLELGFMVSQVNNGRIEKCYKVLV